MLIFQHLLDGRIQKLDIGRYYANFALYHISLSSWEEVRREIFSLWSAQDGWKHLPKHQMQVMMTFWKLVLTMSSMKYVVDKLNNSLTVCGYFMLAHKLSPTGREFCPLSIPMIKVKYQKEQFFTILYLYVWEFVKSFHPPNVTN